MGIFFGVCAAVVLSGIILLVKNNVTYNNRSKINDAIYLYCLQQIKYGVYIPKEVHQFQMEDYNKTFFRMYDWGYKNIVPKDVYEKIKPYIK